MAEAGDDVLRNILGRLPGKPLLRFRCVSKHWNCVISDPYFIKSRSRRMFFFSFPHHFVVIDPSEAHWVNRIPYPDHYPDGKDVLVVGTFNGIELLALTHHLRHFPFFSDQLILYNPLTCVSKLLPPNMDLSFSCEKYSMHYYYQFGFGYGVSPDDLKIVRFGAVDEDTYYVCEVFDLKTRSWSTLSSQTKLLRNFIFLPHVNSTFVNRFLYWVISSLCVEILALDVKNMVFSKIKVPNEQDVFGDTYLGQRDGCLCMIKKIDTKTNFGVLIDATRFDVWLLIKKQDNSFNWLKAQSFKLLIPPVAGLESNSVELHTACISSDGNILNADINSMTLFIYNTSKDSCKMVKGFTTLYDSCKREYQSCTYSLLHICSVEYVESLVSPSDLCFS